MINQAKEAENLLVGDNSTDAELAIRALKNSCICKPIKFDEFVKVVSELGIYWLLVNQRRRW